MMKIVDFKSKENNDKKISVDMVLEELPNCTHFIFCYSTDNLEVWRHIRFNLSSVESIGCIDVTKHRFLHDVLATDDDDDDGPRKDLPEECASGI